MGTFYEEKKKVIATITGLVETSNWTKEQITFFVERETGFSPKFIMRYIDDNIENKIWIKEKGGVIVSNQGNKNKDK